MPHASTIILWGALVLAIAGFASPAVRAQGALPSSIAHYELTHDGRTERLDVVRTSDRIEHRYLARGITEIWTRSPSGELEHWKVFHQAKRSVHYTNGDLRTIEAEPSWEKLAAPVEAEQRAKLKAKGTKRSARSSAGAHFLSEEACSVRACAPFDTTTVREIEFADLGDMEGDPFVRSFLTTFAGRGHSH